MMRAAYARQVVGGLVPIVSISLASNNRECIHFRSRELATGNNAASALPLPPFAFLNATSGSECFAANSALLGRIKPLVSQDMTYRIVFEQTMLLLKSLTASLFKALLIRHGYDTGTRT